MPNPWAHRRPLLVAHRGGAAEAPENTLYAFRQGVGRGAHMVELDVHATADGELVVIHDAALDRTTDGSGLVAQTRLADLRARDAAHWFTPGKGTSPDADDHPLRGVATGFRHPPAGVEPRELRIPTLTELLEALPDTWITMELKAAGLHQQVADLLEAHGRSGDVIVGGFGLERIDPFRGCAPSVSTSATESEAAAFWSWAHGHSDPPEIAYDALQVPTTYEGIEVVTPAFTERAREAGVAVHVWTIDEPAEMHRLLDLGVDGIMTDRPSVLAAVLRDRSCP